MSRKNSRSSSKNKLPRGNWSKDLWYSYQSKKDDLIDMIFTKADNLSISNYELARISGLSYSTIQKLEDYTTQQPFDTTLFKLCNALDIEVKYI